LTASTCKKELDENIDSLEAVISEKTKAVAALREASEEKRARMKQIFGPVSLSALFKHSNPSPRRTLSFIVRNDLGWSKVTNTRA
jgi:hypothetical protein